MVSPLNARKQLSAFIKGAKKELLIYDPDLSDAAIISLLEERAEAGASVRILGRLTRKSTKLQVHKLSTMRLHTRSIVRDNESAFVGSQSLREAELGTRREVGIIFRDQKIVNRLAKTFQDDWQAVELSPQQVVLRRPNRRSRSPRKLPRQLQRTSLRLHPFLK